MRTGIDHCSLDQKEDWGWLKSMERWGNVDAPLGLVDLERVLRP